MTAGMKSGPGVRALIEGVDASSDCEERVQLSKQGPTVQNIVVLEPACRRQLTLSVIILCGQWVL